MTIGASAGSMTWAHFGDPHIIEKSKTYYHDFFLLIESMNEHLVGLIDFCVLPGDNANNGTRRQYAMIRRALDGLKVPVYALPGDHVRKAGDLCAFYQRLQVAHLPYAITAGGCRCLFLDVVSQGRGGANFALGTEQLRWLGAELMAAQGRSESCVVFMHAYPADLVTERESLQRLLRKHRVALVDMGHTHYNELSNDSTTIFASTRSTGQIAEGPVGFSLVSLNHGLVSWRFKPLRSSWSLVMITSPADHRLLTNIERPGQLVVGQFSVMARVFGASLVKACRCRINEGPWMPLRPHGFGWERLSDAPPQQFTLTVEATDMAGMSGTDAIIVATTAYRPPSRYADGSDADALSAWPERHVLGTRLGPNRSGRQW